MQLFRLASVLACGLVLGTLSSSTFASLPSAVEEGVGGNITIKNHAEVNDWWYAFYVEDNCDSLSTVEIKDADDASWRSAAFANGYWSVNTDGFQFLTPISIRLTSSQAAEVTGDDIVTSLTGDAAFDLGGQFPCATGADLTVTKTNSVSGATDLGSGWTWSLDLANEGGSDAVFSDGQVLLRDDLPSSGLTYGSVSVDGLVGVSGPGSIDCAVNTSTLTCTATGGGVTLAGTIGAVRVDVEVTPTEAGTYDNPRIAGQCLADPDSNVTEDNEDNNACTDSVSVNEPAEAITIKNHPDVNQWWYAFYVEDNCESLTTAEIKDADDASWRSAAFADGYWSVTDDGFQFVTPISVRLTSSQGAVVTGDNLVTNLTGDATFDLGGQFPCSTSADLTVTKTNSVSGATNPGTGWTWSLDLANGAGGDAVFSDGQVILRDDLPSSGLTYGSVSVNGLVGVSGRGSIDCAVNTATLTCTATGGGVTLAGTTGALRVDVEVTSTEAGTYDNPRAAGQCLVDPDSNVTEDNEANNACADSVSVTELPDLGVEVCLGYISFFDAVSDEYILAHLAVPGYSDNPFNVVAMSFWLSSSGPVDSLDVWVNPDDYLSLATRELIAGTSNPDNDEFRSGVRALDRAAGLTRLVAAFGATDHPLGNGQNATDMAQQISTFVTTHQLDGVVVDWEEGSYFDHAGTGENWLITLQQQLRAGLGESAVIAHAPQAPYLGATVNFPSGGYLTVHDQVGSTIDWYAVQFYNQGSTTYDSYETLVEQSNGWASNTAILQMVNGSNTFGISVPANKIVVGKPIAVTDGAAGWLTAADLAVILDAAPVATRGVAGWRYESDLANGFEFGKTLCGGWNSIFSDGFESGNTSLGSTLSTR